VKLASRLEVKPPSSTPVDAEICGEIYYRAFKMISEANGFVPDVQRTSRRFSTLY
jgi:hypothetical protein